MDREGIFLSFAAADEVWAEWMRSELEHAGHRVIAEDSDLGPGSSWKLELEAELAGSGPSIAIVSPDYLAMLRGQSLLDFLSSHDVIAVRVRECEDSWKLERVEVENLVGLEEEAARSALLAAASRLAGDPVEKGSKRGKMPFPAAVPPIWHVPQPRNPEFLGRTQLLKEIREALKHDKIVALTGVAGVGKTELANEYAYRCAGDYSLVWWIRAEDEEWLAADLRGLAQRLKPGNSDPEKTIRRWLALHDRWLLVLDEAPDPDELPHILPRRRRGHVIVTSLSPSRDERTHLIAVPTMDRAEAIGYLLENTEGDQREEAAAIADLVGNMPAALQLVAATARERGLSIEELARALEADEESSEDVRAMLTHAIQEQLHILGRESPRALELLELAAFFAPDDIPITLLEGWRPLMMDASEEGSTGVAQLVQRLGERGFVTVAKDAVFVHRLVRVAARETMSEETKRLQVEAALNLVSEAFAYQVEYNENWSVTARVLPHALSAARHAERRGIEPATVSWVLNQIGLYHLQRANYADAAAALRRALALAEGVFEATDLSIGVIANNLGSALQNLGELEEAETLAGRSVTILASGENSAELGIALANLGSVFRDRRKYPEARQALERAIEVETEAHGPEDPIVALRLNDLGRILREQGDLAAARVQLERACKLVADRNDLEPPRLAPILWNLGEVCRQLGDFAGSRALLEQTLPLVEDWYGPSHPEVAKHSRSLGLTLYEAGHPEEAMTLLRRALAIDQGAFGPDHPAVAADANALKAVLANRPAGLVETLVSELE